MKISIVIFGVITMIISVTAIATLTNGFPEANNDKLRVAFFPSIGHAVPIVGLENEIFQERIGEQSLTAVHRLSSQFLQVQLTLLMSDRDQSLTVF